MTAELRDSIQKLRTLSPKFNAAAEDAAKTVKAVEAFLTDECKAGITASVTVETEVEEGGDPNDYPGMFLDYSRVNGKYRITVQINSADGNGIERTVTPWSDCSRGDKLKSFVQLPDLLEDIAAKMEMAIASAAKTTTTVSDVMTALAGGDAETDDVGKLPRLTPHRRTVPGLRTPDTLE